MIDMKSQIESIIKDKNVTHILGYPSPPSSVHIEKMTWILFSSQGFTTKKGAQQRLDEIDADPSMSLIGVPREVVRWTPPYRSTPKYYIYYRWKRDEE